MRILRHGLTVNEIAESPLMDNAIGIWSIKSQNDDEFDKYLVITFKKSTIVLSVTGESISEVNNSGVDSKK